MGRPLKILSTDQITQLEKLAAVLSQDQIADFFGMTSRTLRKRLATDPLLAAAYKRGRAAAISGVATKLLAKCNSGNVTAMIFYLKTQAGWREQPAAEVPVPKVGDLTDKQIEKERRRLGLAG